MRRLSLSMFALLMMSALVGCGGSSVKLPKSVMTDELYAIEWYDTQAMKPDDAMKMLNDVAEDMSDDQPKARLWMSAAADSVEANTKERWEAFHDAGGEGFLVLHYAEEVTTGEGDNATTNTEYRTYVLVRVKKGTSTGDLAEALKDFAKEDGNEKIKFIKVKDEEQWFFLSRETAEGQTAPELPEGGGDDATKKFTKLMNSAGDASCVMVWTMPKKVKEDIEKALKVEGISDEQKDRLNEQLHTESVVMAVSTGGSPSIEVTILFDDKDRAESFAEEHNGNLVNIRRGLKTALVESENPPHPSVVNRLVEKMEIKPSGKKVTLTMDSSQVRDGLSITAATRGRGGVDTTSPMTLVRFGPQLNIPRVPGVIDVNSISFRDQR